MTKFRKLYVDFKIPDTIEEFLQEFFSKKHFQSIYGVKTFSDRKCTNIQCKDYRRRSFDDIYRLVRTYYGEQVTVKELIGALAGLKIKGYFLQVHYCDVVKKPVCFFSEYGSWNISQYGFDDENKFSKYGSWKELFSLININNSKQISEYKHTLLPHKKLEKYS